MYVCWSIHGAWSQKCLCSLATRLKTLTTKLFQKHFHAIKLSYSSYQPIYFVPLWHKVYSSPVWPVEDWHGQRKDTANQRACWSMPSSKDKESSEIQDRVHLYRHFVHLHGESSELTEELKSSWLCYCFALFWLRSSPRTWETSCFQFCHTFVAPELYLCPLLTAGFTLACLHMQVWIPRQNKLAQKHTFDSQFCMQVHMRSFGRVTRTSKHHQYELSKELFHHVLWKDMLVFPQLLLRDIPSPLLNYQK